MWANCADALPHHWECRRQKLFIICHRSRCRVANCSEIDCSTIHWPIDRNARRPPSGYAYNFYIAVSVKSKGMIRYELFILISAGFAGVVDNIQFNFEMLDVCIDWRWRRVFVHCFCCLQSLHNIIFPDQSISMYCSRKMILKFACCYHLLIHANLDKIVPIELTRINLTGRRFNQKSFFSWIGCIDEKMGICSGFMI